MSTAAVRPPVDGGDYQAIDTKDGWVILRNMPTMSTVPKGTKNAPEDIGTEWLEGAKKFGMDLYEKGKVCYPIHVGHNDDLGITKPEFAGFFKPTKVADGLVEGAKKPVLFADWKIKKNIYDRMAAGELPFVSPEVRNWSKRKVSSVALLDSQTPHFGFPNQTITSITDDPNAKFSADLPQECEIVKFDDKELVKFDLASQADPARENVHDEAAEKCCSHCSMYGEKLGKISKMLNMEGTIMADEKAKPGDGPVDQKNAIDSVAPAGDRMTEELTPALAAKFAAQEERLAAAERRMNERDAKDAAQALATKALESLKGYQVTEATKNYIAQFAEKGEAELNKFIEAVKPSLYKESARTFAKAEESMVSTTDPMIAKFASRGVDATEKAIKFAEEYRAMKHNGAGMRISEEAYIAFRMDEAVASN